MRALRPEGCVLIERWHSLNAFDPQARYTTPEFDSRARDNLKITFQPALRRLVHAGLLIIEHNLDQDWSERIVDLLVETFEACGRLEGLMQPANWNSFFI